MESRDRVGDFFKRFDRYPRKVGLTYKQSGTFDTSAGGFFSILSFFLLGYFLSEQIIGNFILNYKYNVSHTLSNTLGDNTMYPFYNVTQDQLILTYRMIVADPIVKAD